MNDVLYDPASGDIFMPNLNQFANVKDPAKYPQTGNQNLSNVPLADETDKKDDPKKEEKDNAKDESNDQG